VGRRMSFPADDIVEQAHGKRIPASECPGEVLRWTVRAPAALDTSPKFF
jgi:hypothetical protein